jgi:hypothetical protein
MKKILLLLIILCSWTFGRAQETIGAPYNPDSNADSLINLPDMLSILPLFGQPFLPSEDDLDSENEIQSLYLTDDTLYLIPNGGFILLSDLLPAFSYDSLLSSLVTDSTFLTNIGSTIGSCSYHFPDGYGGVAVNASISFDEEYVVPAGKRLYLLGWRFGDPVLNGLPESLPLSGDRTLMLNPGETLGTSDPNGSVFNALLVNASSSVEAISETLSSGALYSVPQGKTLYLLGWRFGDPIFNGQSDALPLNSDRRYVLNQGETIGTTSDNFSLFNAYLVDENHFSNCYLGELSNSSAIEPTIYSHDFTYCGETFDIPSDCEVLFYGKDSPCGSTFYFEPCAGPQCGTQGDFSFRILDVWNGRTIKVIEKVGTGDISLSRIFNSNGDDVLDPGVSLNETPTNQITEIIYFEGIWYGN